MLRNGNARPALRPASGAINPLGTRLLTWFRGELVGTDSYGNRYYRECGEKPLGHFPSHSSRAGSARLAPVPH